MTNLNRLKLELCNKDYYTDEEYSIFLEEQGLIPTSEYSKQDNQLSLLNTVIDILQTLSNNIDYYCKIETEFINKTEAYKNLKSRIDELYTRISLLPSYEPQVNQFSYLFHN